MKKTAKAASVILVLTMLLSLLTVGVVAEADGWWTEEVWDTETLLSLGAEPPVYNRATGYYEISSPEQLLFLSGAWKSVDTNGDGRPDAPRDGHYVLTADIDMGPLMDRIGEALTAASGEETEGYMPPISANKSENDDKTDGYFRGVLDGQYHTISNLAIHREDGKYTALIGYLGDEGDPASIRNLGLADIKITGKKTCGAFVGVCYGTVENCFATGTVKAKQTTGGLIGKLEGDLVNCFAYMDVKAKELAGVLVGSIETDGNADSCYVGGSLKLGEVSGGGVAGAFSAADRLQNVASAVHSVTGDEGATDLDRFVGTMEGESGANIQNNRVWEGAVLEGNGPQEYPDLTIYQFASADELMTRSLYEKELGWDFDGVWTWVGTANSGYPMLKGFVKAGNAPELLDTIRADMTQEQPVLNIDNPIVKKVEKGEKAVITASLTLPTGMSVDTVQVFYGTDTDGTAFTDSVEMVSTRNGYTATLPLTEYGTYYYYVAARVAEQTLTVPYDITGALPLVLDDGIVDPSPTQILCQVGTTCQEVGLNWITVPAVTDSKVWYRQKGATDWTVIQGQSELSYLVEGWDDVQSHWATITGLEAEATYEYAVGGVYEGAESRSDIYQFTTLPASGAFTFMQYSDLQAEEADGYLPFVNTMADFVSTLPDQPDFLLNTGDIVDSAYKSAQWEDFFDMTGSYMANRLNILLPGNHDHAGDLTYKQYGARTSLPNELEYGPLEGTGWCVIGDACFVFVNSDPYSGEEGADIEADRARFFKEQTAWAEEVYENADCTWRIMASHIGPYIVNFNDPSDYPYITEMCDRLQVDLYMNGHDHEYIRTTTKDNVIREPGQGTTYMTCSSLGEKLDAFKEGTAADKYAVVHKDGAEESQQIFSMVTVDESGIHVTAYQRGVEEDWSSYDVIDRYDITTSLTKGEQSRTPAQSEETVPAEQPSGNTYTVQAGDCLYRIAQEVYGNGARWEQLYEANRDIIHDPTWIYIGQVLNIPAK